MVSFMNDSWGVNQMQGIMIVDTGIMIVGSPTGGDPLGSPEVSLRMDIIRVWDVVED